ncbi:MAG: hypothetical protein MUF29_09005 [Chitinophagaceae bacterium]|nr:hypothetical protein [Chitinophagaceae bacterium]
MRPGLPCGIFLVALFLFRSALAQPLVLPTPASLHDLPLVYTGKEPELFLPGQTPARPFIRTHIVEAVLPWESNANDLIKALRKQGTAEGVDALLLHDLGQRVAGASGGLVVMQAIGAKYTDNLDYLPQLIRQRVFTVYQTNGASGPSTIVNYSWRGRYLNAIDAAGQAFYTDSVLPFDASMLFVMRPAIFEYNYDESQVLTRIRLAAASSLPVNVQWLPREGSTDEELLVRITRDYDEPRRYQLQRVVERGRLTGAIIRQKDEPVLYLYYMYDEAGRLISERWERIMQGRKLRWMEVENRYYSSDPATWPH